MTSDNVAAIVGADCSGVTTAIRQQRGDPERRRDGLAVGDVAGALDHRRQRLFFRTAPSDARQGEILAQIVMEQGMTVRRHHLHQQRLRQGFAAAFQAAFEKLGGKIALSARTRTARPTIPPRSARSQAAGGEALVVPGYVDQGGVGIVQASLDTGAFEKFFFPTACRAKP